MQSKSPFGFQLPFSLPPDLQIMPGYDPALWFQRESLLPFTSSSRDSAWQASVTLRKSSLCCPLTAFIEIGKTDFFLQHSPAEFTSQRVGNSNVMVQSQSSLIPSGNYWKEFLSPATPLQSMLKGSALLYVDSLQLFWYLERFLLHICRARSFFFGRNQSWNSEEKRAHQRTGKEFNN